MSFSCKNNMLILFNNMMLIVFKWFLMNNIKFFRFITNLNLVSFLNFITGLHYWNVTKNISRLCKNNMSEHVQRLCLCLQMFWSLDFGLYQLSKHEHHCDISKSLKSQHDSFIVIWSILLWPLDNSIPDQFTPVQQIGSHDFRNCITCEIVEISFQTYGCSTATDIAKNWWHHQSLLGPQQTNQNAFQADYWYPDCWPLNIFRKWPALPYHVCIGQYHKNGFFSDDLCDFYCQHDTHNTDWSTFK